MQNNEKKWNALGYQESFDFVYQYGSDVVELLDITSGMKVLDIGSGNGTLAKQISKKGAHVTGIDNSNEMVLLAKNNYPEIKFVHMNATEIMFREEFDAVFSNAVFHWISDQEKLINGVSAALKRGGHLVCEFGGEGCAEAVHTALKVAFEKRNLTYINPFYFPRIGEYAPMLEAQGLRVEYATLFQRPTKLKEGETVVDWINMFITQTFEGIDLEIKNEILQETEENLRPTLCKDNEWFIDYVRIRIKAVKI